MAKPAIVAADFATDGVVGALAKLHVGILEKQAEALKEESETALERYLKTHGGTAEAKALNLASYEKYMESDSWARRALSLDNKVEARLPVVGLAITAVDIGYDIHTGKPVGKAIVSGAIGFWAATEAGAAIGTAIPVPVVGTVVGAVAGATVGLLASGAADALYDSSVAAAQAGKGSSIVLGQPARTMWRPFRCSWPPERLPPWWRSGG
jgi:hypothetical protein